jgi:hypothetical protein
VEASDRISLTVEESFAAQINSVRVRSATPDDVSLIFSFIQKKSEFDEIWVPFLVYCKHLRIRDVKHFLEPSLVRMSCLRSLQDMRLDLRCIDSDTHPLQANPASG